ncbi:DoxX family protein [Flavobacterium sp. J27]|uniref:DoxX family protein n=1 Tax=Flavobacterium sp. J27 TaxID=2060419 RepID=UPI00103088CA|nr:DoxX family protein [Flavobacterium sp. J27]
MWNKIRHNTKDSYRIDGLIFSLRTGIALLIFLNHGVEKIVDFNAMLITFPDPLGIGKLPSLLFAFMADVVGSVFLFLGLLFRWSALLIASNLLVAFFIVHKANLMEIHGELALVYLIIILFLFFFGPGNRSLDSVLKISNRNNK